MKDLFLLLSVFLDPEPKSLNMLPLNVLKKKDIQAMIKFMPLDDAMYMKSLI